MVITFGRLAVRGRCSAMPRGSELDEYDRHDAGGPRSLMQEVAAVIDSIDRRTHGGPYGPGCPVGWGSRPGGATPVIDPPGTRPRPGDGGGRAAPARRGR